MQNNRSWIPLLLIAPSIVFLTLLFLVPLVQTIWLSGTAGGSPSLENYRRMAPTLISPARCATPSS